MRSYYREVVGDDTLVDEGDGAFRQLGFALPFADVSELFRIVLPFPIVMWSLLLLVVFGRWRVVVVEVVVCRVLFV